MGERNAGVGRDAAGGGDAGHDLEGNAGGGQRLDFLAAAAEDERVAALQPHHALALARQPHQQLVDLVLAERMVAALLAGVDALGLAAAQLEDRLPKPGGRRR